MGSFDDVLGVSGYRDGDLVGEILGAIEGDESVDAQIILPRRKRAKTRVHIQGLSRQPIEAVLDTVRGEVQCSGDRSAALAFGMTEEDAVHVDSLLGVVLDAEGLAREGCAALHADESCHSSERFGWIESI